MPPRIFAGIVGGILTLVGLLALAIPVSVDDGATSVSCGSGFSGLSSAPGLHDAGHELGAIIAYGVPVNTPYAETLEAQCEDKLGDRQAWGWPVGGLGVIAAAGSLLIHPRPRARPTPQGYERPPGYDPYI